MEETARLIQYDDANFHSLLKQLPALSRFTEVMEWDAKARSETERIVEVVEKLDAECEQQFNALVQIKSEHSRKSFLGKMFASGKQERHLAQIIERCRNHKVTLEEMVTRMLEAIDFTPNSAEDQTALLKELRLRKKELQVQKREVSASMKAIRTDARQQSAQAGTMLGITYSTKVASSQRRSIRYTKESALRPHEDIKAAIERQLIQVDRDMLWVERFKE